MRLLTNASNGNGVSFAKGQWGNREIDQFCTLFVWGTFNGAAVTFEISPDGVEWFDSGVSITAKAAQNVEFRAGYVRAVVTGGAAPSLNALLL